MKKIYRTLLVVLLSAGVFSVKAQDTKTVSYTHLITGVSHDGSYFLIEMRKEYLIYLPLLVGSKFRILTKQKQLYS